MAVFCAAGYSSAATYYVKPLLLNTVEDISGAKGASAWNTNTIYRLGTASGTMTAVPAPSDDDEESAVSAIPAVKPVNAQTGYTLAAMPTFTYDSSVANPIPLPVYGSWTAKDPFGNAVNNLFTTTAMGAFAVQFDYDDTTDYDLGWHFHAWAVYERSSYSSTKGVTGVKISLLEGAGATHTVTRTASYSETFADIYRYPLYWPILAKNTYTVVFDPNGGAFDTAPAGLTVTNGVAATLPSAAPVRAGCEFKGWALQAGGDAVAGAGGSYAFSATTGARYKDGDTIMLYAVWESGEFTVELGVSPEGAGTVSGAGTYTVFDSVDFAATANEGWKFARWSPAMPSSIVSNSVYTAIFNPNGYTVEFDANGGTGEIFPQSFTYGTAQALTKNSGHLTRTGHEFIGWAYSADAATPDYIDNQTVKNLTAVDGGVVKLYAVWRKTAHQVAIGVSPEGSGAIEGAVTGLFAYGDTIALSAVPAAGYEFTRWSDGSTQAARTVSVSAALNLTAHFSPVGYSVVFVRSNGAATTNLVSYGEAFAAPAAATGWAVEEDGAAAIAGGAAVSNLTSTAGANIVFREAAAIDRSTVSFSVAANPVEGGSVASSIAEGVYPTNVTAILAATPADGWQFKEWNDGSSDLERTAEIAAGGVSFVASFEKIPPAGEITAVFNQDMTTITNICWRYGDNVALPDPTIIPPGRTFAGWWDSSYTMQLTADKVTAMLAAGESATYDLRPYFARDVYVNTNATTAVLGLDVSEARLLRLAKTDKWIADGDSLRTSTEIDNLQSAELQFVAEVPGRLVFKYRSFEDSMGGMVEFDDADDLFTFGNVKLSTDTRNAWVTVTNDIAAGAVACKYKNPVNNFTIGDYAGAELADFEWTPATLEWNYDEESRVASVANTIPSGGTAEYSREFTGPGVLSFEWMASAPFYVDADGATNRLDSLSLLVDGAEVAIAPMSNPEYIPVCWTNTLEGSHTYTWRFTRTTKNLEEETGNNIGFAFEYKVRFSETPFAEGFPETPLAKRDFANVAVAAIPAQIYDGVAVEPVLSVTDGGNAVDASEYTVDYKNNTAPGVAAATIAPAADGGYAGSSKTVAFTIFNGSLDGAFGETEFVYDGTAHTLEFTPSASGATVTYIVDGGSETDEMPKFTDAGTYSVIVLASAGGRDKYATRMEVMVSPCDISGFAMPSIAAQAWTGLPIMPAVEIPSLENADFTLEYKNNVSPGTATIVVRGQGNYTGAATIQFEITAPAAGISFDSYTCDYDGAVHSLAGASATPSWAAISYSGTLSATAAGTYSATATAAAEGYESAVASAKLVISPRDISNVSIAAIADQTYTGVAITPAVSVSDSAAIDSGDYTVSYANNVAAGTATATITGRRNYRGAKSVSFKIVSSASPDDPDGPDWPDAGLRLSNDASTVFTASAATKFNGFIYNADGSVAGTVLLQVGKANKKTGAAKITAKVVALSGKTTFKGVWSGGEVELESAGNVLTLAIYADSFTGTFNGMPVDGARNYFLGRSDSDKAVAAAALDAWKGTYVVSTDAGTFALVAGAKGKVKLKGTSASGANVSVSGLQLSVADTREAAAIPVAIPKLATGFVVWVDDAGKVFLQGADGVAARHDPSATFGTRAVSLDEDFPAALGGVNVIASLLPGGTRVDTDGRKWTVAKGGNPKYVDGAFVPKNEANPANLKLSYTASTGIFKGAFYVYTAAPGATRAKKTKAVVRGAVVGSEISGVAAIGGNTYGFTLE